MSKFLTCRDAPVVESRESEKVEEQGRTMNRKSFAHVVMRVASTSPNNQKNNRGSESCVA
jgi:hypothetical protein